MGKHDFIGKAGPTPQQIRLLLAERDALAQDNERLADFTLFLYGWLKRICQVPHWYQSKGHEIQVQIEEEIKARIADLELLQAVVAREAKE